MDPKFFRKYADLITEASVPAAPKKEARILEKLVWKITGISNDDGYEWLDNHQGPLGDAWRGFFDDAGAQNNNMSFADWILQHVPHQTIIQLAAQANGIYGDAKFDIQY
jgi:hypothetical protein